MVKDKKNQGAEEKILSAARKIFTTKGMAGARMQDIANEAGINKALLHYYYRDKEKLFETIFLESKMIPLTSKTPTQPLPPNKEEGAVSPFICREDGNFLE